MIKKVILVVAVLAILAAITTLPVQASEVYYYGGHCYSLTDEFLWIDAEAAAEAAGGFLVTINTKAEQDWLTTTFDKDILGSLWIGLYQPAGSTEPDEGFVWASSQPVTFTNWYPGEPNNSGGEMYVAMNEHEPGIWNDLPADRLLRGIVEKNCAVPEPATLLGFGLPMLMVGLGKLRQLRK